MARREVIEVTCDRCGKTQNQARAEIYDGDGPEFEVTFRGVTSTYQDLCVNCRKALTNYHTHITKDAERKKKKTADRQSPGQAT